MIYRRKILALALLAPCFDALATAAEPIEEIYVTATRRSTDITDVAVSVSATDDVTDHKLTTDALESLVGVTVQQTTPGQGAAIIRGLKGSAILHLVDGMRLSNAMFRTAPTPWFALVPSTSVERLEVVRGTPASLYGSEAVGGVVQSVSRMPSFDDDQPGFTRDIQVGFDSAEQQRSIRATLDAGTSELAASLSAEYLETGDRRIGGGERIGPSGYESQGLRAVVIGTPSDERRWFLDVHWLEQPETPRIDELVPGFGQTEPSSSEFFFAPNRRVFVHAQHDYDSTSGYDWKVDFAWQRIDDDRRTRDLDAPNRRYEQNRSDLYGLTANVSREHDSMDWIAGVDLYHDKIGSARFEEDLATGVITERAARFPDGATIDQGGVFVNATWHPSDMLRLSGGLRYSDVRIDLPDGTEINPGKLSADVGLLFDFAEAWQFVINLGQGFRAPNIADLGTLGNRPGNRFNIPNTDLGAENVTHGDVGFRYRGESWQLEFAAFALSYTDRIVSVSTGDVTPEGRDVVQSVNAASSDLRGLEAGLLLRPSEHIDARLVINYARGEQKVGGIAEPADRVPPLSGRVEITWQYTEAWSFDALFQAAAGQDRLSARDVRDVRIDPDGTPGWATMGMGLTWDNGDDWNVSLAAHNLFDARYRVHGSGIDAPGRNFAVVLRRRW